MRSISKATLCAIVLGLCACGNIPRDNPLDPLNPDSTTPKCHLIEAFVNIASHPSNYNQIMLAALDSLEVTYPNRIIIAACHRTIGVFIDPYALVENDIRYQHLLDAIDSDLKGTPDVFINGIAQRIQGASTVESAFFRLQEALLKEMANNENFYLSVASSFETDGLVSKVTVARLGNDSVKNIRIRAVLTANQGGSNFTHVVVASTESDVIDRLSSGEIRDILLPAIPKTWNQPVRLIVSVMSDDETQVYQSTEIDVIE